ncbi:MAG: hypothetical protein Q8O89_02775 [Nanoarchaeota archaeon]|nr:hypothetical protein [Nanoarchaeota archaeon]
MVVQDLLSQLKELQRPIDDADRESLLARLRECQTLDGRPRPTALTNKCNIYFHSVQDTTTADMLMMLERTSKGDEYSNIDDRLFRVQACFAQDLDRYLELLPVSGNEDIAEVFKLVFDVGISACWHEDRALIKNLGQLYRQIDNELIRPWANTI